MQTVAYSTSKESAAAKRPARESHRAPVFDSHDASAAPQPRTCPCGGGCPRCGGPVAPASGGPGAIQLPAELTVNPPGDRYEQEAERVSEHVMRMTEPHGPRAVAIERTGPGGPAETPAPPAVREVVNSTGQPLDTATRTFMESRFGRDFSSTRVHTGAQASQTADAVSALAYTVGEHIVFGEGQYNPFSEPGRRLLAHELAHVAQQNRTGALLQRAPRTRPDVTPDVLADEIRKLLDHTQERYTYYVDRLRPYYRNNATKLGIEATKYLQKDFVAVFGEGVKEVDYSLIATDHRIDLFLPEYRLGIELKLSGKASTVQKRAFFERAWGKKGEAEHTLAYVGSGSSGWWAGAGDQLSAAQLKSLRKNTARLEKQAFTEIEEAASVAGKGERAEAKSAGKAGRAEAEEAAKAERAEAKGAGKAAKSARAEAKEVSKAGGVRGVLGKVATGLSVFDVGKDLMSHDWGAAVKDTISAVAPEIDLLSWGYHKIFGSDSDSEESAPAQAPAGQPQTQPRPGGHYFIVMGDGREIEVEAYALLNEGFAHPVYGGEVFPGEAEQEWQRSRRFRIHFERPE